MRLPFSRGYRSIPELDGFTDEQCRLICGRASKGGEASGAGCFVAVLGAMGVIIVLLLLGEAMPSLVEAGVLLLVAVPTIAGLLARDAMMGRLVRWHLARIACPSCGGTLLGAARSAGAARCGKCGAVHSFGTLGIGPEDLGPPLLVLRPDTCCVGCGYALIGLPVERGVVRCPECGTRVAVAEDGPPPEFLPGEATG